MREQANNRLLHLLLELQLLNSTRGEALHAGAQDAIRRGGIRTLEMSAVSPFTGWSTTYVPMREVV